MKRAALVVLSLVFCAGCLDVEQQLILNGDASGSLEVRYSILEESISQIDAMMKIEREMARVAGETADAEDGREWERLFLNPRNEDLAKKLKQYEKYGVTVDELTVNARGARRHVHLKVVFGNLAKVSQTDVFAQHGFSLIRGPKGSYAIYRPPVSTEYDQTADFSDPETVALLRPLLSGFRFLLTIQTPGRVLRTTAPRRTFNSASWEFEFDRDPNALVALQSQQFSVIFEGTGLSLPEIRRRKAEEGLAGPDGG
ncbi:hypothetical protein ACFLSJ_00820 [Verrucomicrobiota bacterium]